MTKTRTVKFKVPADLEPEQEFEHLHIIWEIMSRYTVKDARRMIGWAMDKLEHHECKAKADEAAAIHQAEPREGE